MEKKSLPRTRIWLLVICLLFTWSALTVVIVTILTGEGVAAMLGVAAMELGYAALFLFLWWRHRWVDLTLLAKSTEKKLVRLQKVRGDKALSEAFRFQTAGKAFSGQGIPFMMTWRVHPVHSTAAIS